MSDLKVVKPTDGEMYLRWCKGNEHAARFIGSLGLISQIADDFVDEDNPKVTGRLLDRSKAMGVLLASIFADLLPNPFFQQNEGILLPLMVNSVAYWEASNDWTISHKRDPGPRRVPLDRVGLVLLVLFVGAMQIMIDKGKELDWFASAEIITLAIVKYRVNPGGSK